MVKAQVFLTDLDDFAAFDEVWRRCFKVPPPRTTIGTTGLFVKDTLVEIDLVAYVPRPGLAHQVVTSAGPKPIANYSEAYVLGDYVLPAGQIASTIRTACRPKRASIRTSRSMVGHQAADGVHLKNLPER